MAFSDNNGWGMMTKSIDIKQYEGPVKTALYGENGYENYIQQTIPTATVRLIETSELGGLGCSTVDRSCLLAPSWVKSTSYWTQSAYPLDTCIVWNMGSFGDFNFDDFDNSLHYGVRPVITISEV